MFQEGARPELEEVVVGEGTRQVHIGWAIKRYVNFIRNEENIQGLIDEVVIVLQDNTVLVVNIVKRGCWPNKDQRDVIEGLASGMKFFVQAPMGSSFMLGGSIYTEGLVNLCEKGGMIVFRFSGDKAELV